VEFADESMEAVCYHAYWASTELARERGRYSSYKGSLWDQGMLPLDTLDLLAKARGGYVEVDRSASLDWDALRKKIAQDGMRNSNCVAIAPTATISNIIGVDASIEPCFGNLSVKSNLSGEFTVINHYLVRDLKRLGLWDDVMVMDLKHFDGSLRPIDRVPQESRRSTPPRSRSSRCGWSKPRRAARSGSTRRSRSTSTWRARRARSWTTPTSWPGCAA
jgi:ribonucleoside-diphosphate reductase alpha chain